MKILHKTLIISLVVILAISCNRKSDYYIPDIYDVITDNGSGTGTVTWTKDKQYLLEGMVFVNDGQVLTIEAGTVIRANTGQGENASALIVSRGGKIIAEGTSVEPIIFTCEGDDLEGSVPLMSKGLWGGVIILGRAPVNTESGEGHIEGISIAEPRGIYGGSIIDDNSGILKYISIRHGGTNIGSGNEINGLTLGGVGNKTTIEYVEVVSNFDDGVEFFGGTVNCKNIVSAFNGDDAFDYDLGFSGKAQFLLGIQDFSEGDLLVEGSGGDNPELGEPWSLPIFYNCTFIGRGENITNSIIQLDRFAGGTFANCIFLDQNHGVKIQYKEGYPSCYNQFDYNNIKIINNICWDIDNNNGNNIFSVFADAGVDVTTENSVFGAYFEIGQNTISNPGIIIGDEVYNILPTGNVSDNLAPISDDWFESVDFKGAFLYDNWTRNWTLLYEEGVIN